jgi:hypothetical protein
VSHTPTYDQLRGERINADVPASETDPQVDQPGRHHLREDPAAVAAVGGSSPGPGADLAEGWSWFGTEGPTRASPVNATRSAHTSAVIHRHGQAPSADQRVRCGQQQPSGQAPHELVPPPAHARDRQQHRTVSVSRDVEADSM